MSDNVTTSTPRTRLSFTNHPAFQLASFTVGILGFVLACFFYFRGQRERKPVYVVQPIRNIIVNRALAVGQRLAVLYDGRSLEAQNVTALQCTFWNAGGEPIKATDIEIPIKLFLPRGAEILDISVIRQSRPLVVNFTAVADKSQTGERTNSATLNFTILEKGNGATLQLVYIGTPDAAVAIEGAVIGAQVTRVSRPLDSDAPKRDDPRFRARSEIVFKIGILLYCAMPFFISVPSRSILRELLKGEKEGEPRRTWREDFRFLRSRKFWAVQGTWTLLLLSAYYYLFYSYPEVPASLLGSLLICGR